jgi:hypothetical protein
LTELDIQFIIKHHKWRFRPVDIWDRYFILLAPLFFIFAGVLMAVNSGLKGDSSISQAAIISFVVILFLIGILLTGFTYNRIVSETLFYSLTLKSLKENTIKSCLAELGWVVIDENRNVIIATTKITLTSWGEIITIITNDSELLFNSRPDGQPFTINKEKINFSKFYERISQKEELIPPSTILQ